MIDFKVIEFSDREWMTERLVSANYQGCDYTFANLYMWREASRMTIADVNGFLCITGQAYNASSPVYLYPAGNGDIVPVMEQLIADAKEKGIEFRLRAVTKEQLTYLEELFPDRFTVEECRDEWDYIYLKEKLDTLAGKKYHGKRNHIARFLDDNDWSYEPITSENIKECMDMNDVWCTQYGCDDEGELVEQCAVREAGRCFEQLLLDGGLLRQHGKVVAFAMGEPLNKDTYVVHIEKAFYDVQGAYPMINQQFVQHMMQNYTYVNREEDMGDEGLRKAKLSYKPEILLEKYTLIFK